MRSQLDRALQRQRETNQPIDMKEKIMAMILRAINARAGGVIQNGVGAAIGWLAAWLLSHGVELSPEAQSQMQVYLVGLGMAVVTIAVQWVQSQAGRNLQKALKLEPDGWIGPETLKRASSAIETLSKLRS